MVEQRPVAIVQRHLALESPPECWQIEPKPTPGAGWKADVRKWRAGREAELSVRVFPHVKHQIMEISTPWFHPNTDDEAVAVAVIPHRVDPRCPRNPAEQEVGSCRLSDAFSVSHCRNVDTERVNHGTTVPLLVGHH